MVGGTCQHCHNYYESIHYTNDYGEICKDCSIELTRPYIAEIENEDGTYTIELDSKVVKKLEVLIDERERQKGEEEETKDWPVWHNGIEYANM